MVGYLLGIAILLTLLNVSISTDILYQVIVRDIYDITMKTITSTVKCLCLILGNFARPSVPVTGVRCVWPHSHPWLWKKRTATYPGGLEWTCPGCSVDSCTGNWCPSAYFGDKFDLELYTSNFQPTGVQTHDLWIMTKQFMSMPHIKMTTQPSLTKIASFKSLYQYMISVQPVHVFIGDFVWYIHW